MLVAMELEPQMELDLSGLDRFWATSAACAFLVLFFCATSILNFSSSS